MDAYSCTPYGLQLSNKAARLGIRLRCKLYAVYSLQVSVIRNFTGRVATLGGGTAVSSAAVYLLACTLHQSVLEGSVVLLDYMWGHGSRGAGLLMTYG